MCFHFFMRTPSVGAMGTVSPLLSRRTDEAVGRAEVGWPRTHARTAELLSGLTPTSVGVHATVCPQALPLLSRGSRACWVDMIQTKETLRNDESRYLLRSGCELSEAREGLWRNRKDFKRWG